MIRCGSRLLQPSHSGGAEEPPAGENSNFHVVGGQPRGPVALPQICIKHKARMIPTFLFMKAKKFNLLFDLQK